MTRLEKMKAIADRMEDDRDLIKVKKRTFASLVELVEAARTALAPSNLTDENKEAARIHFNTLHAKFNEEKP